MGLALLLASGCDSGEGDSDAAQTQGGSEAGTDGSSSNGTGSTSGDATSGTTNATTTSAGTVTSAGSSDGSTGDASDTQASATNPTSDTGVTFPISCSLQDLDPTTDPADVLDYGDGEGQIPTIVGEVLLRTCGCHYTDNIIVVVDYTFENAQPLSTLADFQNDFLGIIPFDYNDRPTYEAVEQRVIFEEPLPMPTLECASPGSEPPVPITEEDKAVLQAWFDADAPDGATFTYP